MEHHFPGEVIHRQYEVLEVRQRETGGALYECKRLSDGVDVVVECWFPCEASSPSTDTGLLEAEATNESTVVDSFEVDGDEEGRKLYIVRLEGSRRQEEEECSFEPELRECPVPSSCTVYTFGDRRLEADIPCRGMDGGYAPLEVLFSLLPMIILSWLLYRGIRLIISRSTIGLIVLVTIILLFWLYGFYWLCKKPQSVFGHTNIVIAPDEFKIKTTLRLTPQPRDSVNHAHEAGNSPTLADRLFCKQITGKTSDLHDIQISVWHGQHGSKRSMVLHECSKKHRIQLFVSKYEMEWLVHEVKQVLGMESRQQTP